MNYNRALDKLRERIAISRMGKPQSEWPRIVRVTPQEFEALRYYMKVILKQNIAPGQAIKFADCKVVGPGGVVDIDGRVVE